MQKDIISLTKKLTASPIFNLSLGSKELFHSNFWAWLFETPDGNSVSGSEYIKVFFPQFPYQKSTEYEVRREYLNMDVMIEPRPTADNADSQQAYVIENKIKSIPREAQLKEYQDKLGKKGYKDTELLLTSILAPTFDLPGDWKTKQLPEIGRQLRTLASRESGYRKDLIHDYSDYIEALSQLMLKGPTASAEQLYNFNHSGNSEKKETLRGKPRGIKDQSDLTDSPQGAGYPPKSNEFLEQLGKLRIYDLYVKRGASVLMSYLEKAVSNLDLKNELTFNYSYNNGKSTCDIYVGDSDSFRLGIQIEGYQYRYHFMSKDNFTEWLKDRKDLGALPDSAKYLIKEGWFTKDPNDPKGNLKANMRNQFCFYRPAFLYQYRPLTPRHSFEEISSMLIKDLKRADQMIDQLNDL